ncbi:MAG TPA: hypothetical protein VFX50_18985, partial [Gemmatimonadales bacterium]|nr:hypothetical protein [Gemmatimonadales bacterium]
MNKLVHAAACAALLLTACGPEAPALSAPSAPRPATKPAAKAGPGATVGASAQALAISGPGASAHDLYATRGFTCEACHPCGKRIPGGHAQPWMDIASASFHAFQANQGLAAC